MAELFNLEAEQELLGQLLFQNSLFDIVADHVTGSDFSQSIHGRIYDIALSEHSAGKTANPVTIKSYLADDDDFKSLGGIAYLGKLTGQMSMLPAGGLAKQIADLSQRRRIRDGLEQARELCADPAQSFADIVECADFALTDQARDGVHQPSGVDCMDELIAGFSEKQIGVLSRSIGSLDGVLGPLRPKQFVVTAARPGMGKTAVALSYGLAAAQNGSGVLFVSLEMSSRELAQRMAADLCFYQKPVSFSNIRDGKLSAVDLGRVHDARSTMAELPFQVVDAGYLNVGRLASLIRRHARKMEAQGHKLELVIVDYLQLLSPDSRTRSPYEAVSEVSRALKGMAKENDVAVMALAQLSREVEKRPDKRPQLSDLRDSGQIEQDADSVLFLLRPEYYLHLEEPDQTDTKRIEWESAMEQARNKIEFIVAKRRNGTTGSAQGEFYGQFQAVRG